jgi:hypothetical protein
VTAKEAQQS